MPAKTKFEVKLGPATREAFGRTLAELGRENKDIVVCDADLSKSTMTTYFAKEFPERFVSCGIAEANMAAIASGLAYAGKIPVISSFSAFCMNKGFEQLRCSVAYPNLNVKVVGTHSGISLGEDGPSQMSVEETALACALVGFLVISPADELSCKALFRAAVAHKGPVFVRTGRPKAPIIYSADQKFEIGKAIEVVEGRDVTVIANGLLLAEAILAAGALESEGISVRVLDMHTVKPLDRDAIERAASETWWIADWACAWRKPSPKPGPVPWSSWASTIPMPSRDRPRNSWTSTDWWPAMWPPPCVKLWRASVHNGKTQ